MSSMKVRWHLMLSITLILIISISPFIWFPYQFVYFKFKGAHLLELVWLEFIWIRIINECNIYRTLKTYFNHMFCRRHIWVTISWSWVMLGTPTRTHYFILTTLLTFSNKSSGFILVYLFNWLQSLCPVRKETWAMDIPLNKALVAKKALRSWNLKSSISAFLHAMVKCFLNLLAKVLKT